MMVTVIDDICQGHARCFARVPDFFELDDLGHACIHGKEVPPGLEEDVRAAAETCPERAIRLDA